MNRESKRKHVARDRALAKAAVVVSKTSSTLANNIDLILNSFTTMTSLSLSML
jgi:hypothetical protein